MKIFENRSHLPKLWAIKYRVSRFFYETRCIGPTKWLPWRRFALSEFHSSLPSIFVINNK